MPTLWPREWNCTFVPALHIISVQLMSGDSHRLFTFINIGYLVHTMLLYSISQIIKYLHAPNYLRYMMVNKYSQLPFHKLLWPCWLCTRYTFYSSNLHMTSSSAFSQPWLSKHLLTLVFNVLTKYWQALTMYIYVYTHYLKTKRCLDSPEHSGTTPLETGFKNATNFQPQQNMQTSCHSSAQENPHHCQQGSFKYNSYTNGRIAGGTWIGLNFTIQE